MCNPMDHSLAGFSVHGILQARILEWVAMPSSRGSSRLRDRTQGSSCIAGRFFTSGPPGEALTELIHVVFWYWFDFVFHLWLSDSSGVYSDMWCKVWVQFYLFHLATTCLNIIYEIKSPPSAEKEREEPLVFSKRKKFTKVALWCLT